MRTGILIGTVDAFLHQRFRFARQVQHYRQITEKFVWKVTHTSRAVTFIATEMLKNVLKPQGSHLCGHWWTYPTCVVLPNVIFSAMNGRVLCCCLWHTAQWGDCYLLSKSVMFVGRRGQNKVGSCAVKCPGTSKFCSVVGTFVRSCASYASKHFSVCLVITEIKGHT